jgi:hypothetical protein
MVCNGWEGCDLHGMWLVMLESAKDRVLGVDIPGQQVMPRVGYGTACLIIRDLVGSVQCRFTLQSPHALLVTFTTTGYHLQRK